MSSKELDQKKRRFILRTAVLRVVFGKGGIGRSKKYVGPRTWEALQKQLDFELAKGADWTRIEYFKTHVKKNPIYQWEVLKIP